MNGVVVYVTATGRESWREWSLKSWQDAVNSSPVAELFVHNGNKPHGFELGALKDALATYPKAEEFWIVQDSVKLKAPHVIEDVFSNLKGHGIFFARAGKGYFCKFRREVIEKIGLPYPHGKLESIHYEDSWIQKYRDADNKTILYGQALKDSMVFKEFLGKKRMVNENDYFVKIKSVWHPDMVNEQ